MDQAVAVVTGANRGLGRATSRALAEQGYHVVLCARDSESGADTMASLQAEQLSCELRRVDITRQEDVAGLARHLGDNLGRVDVLVNNAGVNIESRSDAGKRSADPTRVSPMTVMETLNINTLGALRCIQALAPLFTEGARIINISSGMGQLEEMASGWLGYRMSKTAMNSLTRVFADEFAERGIRVNSVCPGWVRTDLGGEQAERSIEEGIDTIVWLATSDAPAAKASGRFFRDREQIAW